MDVPKRDEVAPPRPEHPADVRSALRRPRCHQGYLWRRGGQISLERDPLRGVSPDRRWTHRRACTGAVDCCCSTGRSSRPVRSGARPAADAFGLHGGLARARHLGQLGGDELRASGARLQPPRHAGPSGFQRGHLPHLTAVPMLNAIDNDHPKNRPLRQSYSMMVSFSRATGQLRCRLRSLTMRARSGA